MIFRYDFGEKLDLSKFQKQAPYYIGRMRQLTYHIFVKDYKIVADISTPDNSNIHNVSMTLFEIKRDNDGEIKSVSTIYPYMDLRFKELHDITNIFTLDSHEAHFGSNNVARTVEELSAIIKIIHKINNLKAFL